MSFEKRAEESARKITNERMTLVTPTPSDQPVFAPM